MAPRSKGCDECADFLGRSADISVGSVGSMNGWTSVIIRTERGRLAFQAARSKLDVRGFDDPAALLRLDALDKKIADRSLQRKLDPDAPLFIDFEEHLRLRRLGPPTRVHPPLTSTAAPVLHVPDEPTVRAERWLTAVLDGGELEPVLTGADGIVAWLWTRWRILATAGVGEEDLGRIVLGYRRRCGSVIASTCSCG